MNLDAETLRTEYVREPLSADSDFITIVKLLTIVNELQQRVLELELQQLNMVEAVKLLCGGEAVNS